MKNIFEHISETIKEIAKINAEKKAETERVTKTVEDYTQNLFTQNQATLEAWKKSMT